LSAFGAVFGRILKEGFTVKLLEIRFWGVRENKKMAKWEFFTDREVEGLQHDFIAKLVDARRRTIALDPWKKGIPFIITSGYRSPEKNQSILGTDAVPDSAHLKGLAVDLLCKTSEEAGIICDALAAAGILRRGIYVNSQWQPVHVHCDVDPEKKPERCIYIRKEV
jgi:hypothetical protein